MGDLSERLVEDYRAAREAGDYATQAGILVSLLQSMLASLEPHAQIARETAEAILRVRAAS